MLAREAFHQNRAKVRRTKGKKRLRLRGERIERTFAHACETGAHRRARLRGRDNVQKRYLAHLAAMNLGLVVRKLFGAGPPGRRQPPRSRCSCRLGKTRNGHRVAGFLRRSLPWHDSPARRPPSHRAQDRRVSRKLVSSTGC
jgi:hypothetical protein